MKNKVDVSKLSREQLEKIANFVFDEEKLKGLIKETIHKNKLLGLRDIK